MHIFYLYSPGNKNKRCRDREPSLELAVIREFAARTIQEKSKHINVDLVSNKTQAPEEATAAKRYFSILDDKATSGLNLQTAGESSLPSQDVSVYPTGKQYPCTWCYSACDTQKDLDAHTDMFHRFVCKQCNKAFPGFIHTIE